MKKLLRFLFVMTMVSCFSGITNAKTYEACLGDISMWVGESYTIDAPSNYYYEVWGGGYSTSFTSYNWEFESEFFLVEYPPKEGNLKDRQRIKITISHPFQGTKTIGFSSKSTSDEFKIIYKITCIPVNVTLYPTSMSMNVGESRTLQWQFSPNTSTLGTEISFSSSDVSVADVDLYGKVTAMKPGTATITATTNYGTTATCEVTVSGLSLDQEEAEMHVGDQLRLTATMLPTGESQRVTWSSSDPTVAKVVGGVVYALEWGECVVTATTIDGSNLSANCLISVLPGQSVTPGKRGDLTNDDVVDVSDVNALIDIILGK